MVLQFLEARDAARLAEGQTFLAVGKARIRYRSAGADPRAPTVVFLNGFVAPLDQWNELQQRVTAFAPTLAYDRGGLGLSQGSSAHDAASQATELLDVVTGAGSRVPIVLASYSSSALVARVFASRHPELVQGLVFIDPDNPEQILERAYLDRYERGSPWPARPVRFTSMNAWAYMSGRALISSALGVARLKAWRRNRGAPAASQSRRRLDTFYLLTSHWRAAYAEARVRERSAKQALAWPRAGTDVPVGVISSGQDSEWVYLRDAFELHQKLVERSTQGELLSVPGWNHDNMLEDPAHVPAVVDMIRRVVDKARKA
jgi:pimeloyl-ACP methyl ester carboxylesterase